MVWLLLAITALAGLFSFATDYKTPKQTEFQSESSRPESSFESELLLDDLSEPCQIAAALDNHAE